MNKNNCIGILKIMLLLVFTIFSMLISIFTVYSIDYFDSDWNFKRNITITAGENTPINYNVLIRLADADLGSNFDWTNSCDDVRFTNNGNNLSYWIDDCDTVGMQLDVWIKVDKTLVTAEDYIVELFYKKSGASAVSSASSTFKNDEIFLVSGYCSGSNGQCDMSNAAEALAMRASVGIGSMTMHGSGYVDRINQHENPYGADNNYFTRYRYLFIPPADNTYWFGSRADDDNEIAIAPLDLYGSGIQTGTPYGALDIVTTQYGSWHGGGVCGSNNAIEGNRVMTGGDGYWMDYLMIEGGGGNDQEMCIRTGAGSYTGFDPSNWGGDFFAREYVQNEPSISSISSEVKNPNFVEISFNGILTAVTNKIKFEKTKTFSVDISCNGINTGDSCGNVSSSIQLDSSGFSDISENIGLPFNVVGNNIQSCILNYGQSCTLSWIINATGIVGTISDIRINSDSINLEIIDKISQTFQMEIVAGDVVSFNATTVSIPSFDKNSGNGQVSILAVSDTGDNTNLQVTCESGDCSTITDNFGDGLNLNEGLTSSFEFVCDDSSTGNYSANYSITSDEFSGNNNIIVSCNVLPLYGPISASIVSPVVGPINVIKQDKFFTLNSSINCDNNCGEISAYAIFDGGISNAPGWKYSSILNFSIDENIPIDYQVLAKLNTSILTDGFNWSNSCDDVRMFNPNGSSLNFWVEKCDGILKELDVWIKLDKSYSLGENAIIELYFGKDGASSLSSAVNTFRNDEISFMTGACPSGQPSCNHIDNQAESDFLKQNIGTGSYTVFGSSYINQMNQVSGSHGAGDYYYSRMRTLFIPSVGANYGFGADGDDGVEIGYLPNDGYGNGFRTPDLTGYEKLGDYYGGHGFGTCGSSGNPGSKVLTAGVGYWIDGIHEEGSGGDGFRGCVNSGSGYNVLSVVNFPGQLFARNYVDDEPSLVSAGSASLNIISTTVGDTPLWTSDSQPQTCNPVEDGSCSFEWEINGSGALNVTYNISVYIVSDDSRISEVTSVPTSVIISNSLPLKPVLVNPVIGSKFLSNGDINFRWIADDGDDPIITCSFYLNSTFIQNVSCGDGLVSELNLSLDYGIYNWSIKAIDPASNLAFSDLGTFNILGFNNVKVSKSISKIGVNIYDVRLKTENKINVTNDIIILNFKPVDFNIGVTFPFFDFTNLTSGFYTGDIRGWDFNIVPLSNFDSNYAITNLGTGGVEDNFLLGVE